jgi:hypothetical protein
LSKRTKYVPKHRHAPTRTITEAPKKALRTTVVMSSVAVAATGVAVSGGVLGAPASLSTAAEDLGAAPSPSSDASDSGADRNSSGDASGDARRDSGASRSFDRRDAADPAKEAALSVSDGPAVTGQVDLADGDPRDIAKALMPKFGFSADQFGCLDSLWTRESGWSVSAHNASSGAHGIPQALPGSKMASAGPDWESNPVTQITWGLGYIQDRYGSPCGAWGHSESYGWY